MPLPVSKHISKKKNVLIRFSLWNNPHSSFLSFLMFVFGIPSSQQLNGSERRDAGLAVTFLYTLMCMYICTCMKREKERVCLFFSSSKFCGQKIATDAEEKTMDVSNNRTCGFRWSNLLRRELEQKWSSILLPARMIWRRVTEGGVGTDTQLNILYSQSQPDFSLLAHLAWITSAPPVFLLSFFFLMGKAACGGIQRNLSTLTGVSAQFS